MIKTIVVPTDGSAHAKKAIDLAADIAGIYGARMVILHVLLRHTSESDVEALCKENAMPDALAKKFEDLRRSLSRNGGGFLRRWPHAHFHSR